MRGVSGRCFSVLNRKSQTPISRTALPPDELNCRNITFSESLKRGAENGDVQSMHLYADSLLRRYSCNGDIDTRIEAEKWLIRAAEADFLPAQLDLAAAYWFRFDEIRDRKEADYLISLQMQSIAEGEDFAEFDFNAVRARVPARRDLTDYGKALFYFQKVAERGDCFAAMCAGWFYETGSGGVMKDPNTALDWYLKSAEGGYLPAQSIVGFWHTSGRLKNSVPQAETWYLNIAKRSPYSVTLPPPLETLYGERLGRIASDIL